MFFAKNVAYNEKAVVCDVTRIRVLTDGRGLRPQSVQNGKFSIFQRQKLRFIRKRKVDFIREDENIELRRRGSRKSVSASGRSPYRREIGVLSVFYAQNIEYPKRKVF